MSPVQRSQLHDIYAGIAQRERDEAVRIEHLAASIGHNGGPPIAEPFGLRAAWCRFANALELRRLSILHVRIERRRRALKDLTDERHTIMMRCIRRMRRAEGRE